MIKTATKLATIGCLATAALWGYGTSWRSQVSDRERTELSNLKMISLGTMMYCSDWDDVMPNKTTFKGVCNAIYPYVKNRKVFVCQNPAGGTIAFNSHLAQVLLEDIMSPAETLMFYDTKVWADGTRPMAFVDGHAKILDARGWAVAKKSLAAKYKKFKAKKK